jgi:anti-sigma factor RsiW
MLPELERQLLTAYVDGELSSRQSRQVLKLLHRSEEARTLLRELQENVRALRQLPRVYSHPALSDSVIQLIGSRRLKPQSRPTVPQRILLPAWSGYAAAAAAQGRR